MNAFVCVSCVCAVSWQRRCGCRGGVGEGRGAVRGGGAPQRARSAPSARRLSLRRSPSGEAGRSRRTAGALGAARRPVRPPLPAGAGGGAGGVGAGRGRSGAAPERAPERARARARGHGAGGKRWRRHRRRTVSCSCSTQSCSRCAAGAAAQRIRPASATSRAGALPLTPQASSSASETRARCGNASPPRSLSTVRARRCARAWLFDDVRSAARPSSLASRCGR